MRSLLDEGSSEMTQQQVQRRKGYSSNGKRIRRRTEDQQDAPTANRKIARLWFQPK
jgi:hypothetical protein